MFRSSTAEVTIEQKGLALVGKRQDSICRFEVTNVSPGQVTLRFTNLASQPAKLWLFHRQGMGSEMSRERVVAPGAFTEYTEVIAVATVSEFLFEWQLSDQDGSDNRTARIICKPK
jgi:hypothetical protein